MQVYRHSPVQPQASPCNVNETSFQQHQSTGYKKQVGLVKYARQDFKLSLFKSRCPGMWVKWVKWKERKYRKRERERDSSSGNCIIDLWLTYCKHTAIQSHSMPQNVKPSWMSSKNMFLLLLSWFSKSTRNLIQIKTFIWALMAPPSLDHRIWICKGRQIIGFMPWQLSFKLSNSPLKRWGILEKQLHFAYRWPFAG